MIKNIQKKSLSSKLLNVLIVVLFSIFLVLMGYGMAVNMRDHAGFSFMDTDGGKNYYTEGATLGYRAFGEKISRNISLEHDSCTTICDGSVGSGINVSGPCLIEFFIDSESYAAFDVVPCEKGCSNGACNK